jgi:hypothetical protein
MATEQQYRTIQAVVGVDRSEYWIVHVEVPVDADEAAIERAAIAAFAAGDAEFDASGELTDGSERLVEYNEPDEDYDPEGEE